ncbi:membrane protein [soil metagenome]
MDTIDTSRRIWLLQAFGRNPLVRNTDRLEAVVTVLAFLVALLVLPVACAVGTAVHETQTTYLADARAQRDQVTATVTADSAAVDEPYSAGTLTPVRWTVGFDTHADSVHSQQWVKAGETMDIWIDDRGLLTSPPPDPADPVLAAVLVALTVWAGAATAAAAVVAVVRSQLNRRRYDAWEREFDRLPGNGTSDRSTGDK